MIFFRIDWFDLLALRVSQESSPTPQLESINSLLLSPLSGPTLTSYMATGKTIALTIWTFVSKVMALLFTNNTLSRFIMEKAMATYSSALAWKIPGTGEPGGLPSLDTTEAT